MPGLNEDQSLRFVYLIVLLVLLVGSIGLGRGRGAAKFRYLGVWILIAVGLVTLYAYRGPMLDFAAPVLRELTPSKVIEVNGPGESPLYSWLKQKFPGDIEWNFGKFLVGRDGQVIHPAFTGGS